MNAKFCKDCHRQELPHPDEFKKNHVSSKNKPANCKRCHTWPELCSNCHHIDSSFTRPWIKVHGASVNKNGSADCLKCHGGDSGTDKSFCVKCHQGRKVVPASHRRAKFVRDYSSSKKAEHVQLFEKDAETCTFCHTGDAAELPNSKFCNGCHKLDDAAPGRLRGGWQGQRWRAPEAVPGEEDHQEGVCELPPTELLQRLPPRGCSWRQAVGAGTTRTWSRRTAPIRASTATRRPTARTAT